MEDVAVGLADLPQFTIESRDHQPGGWSLRGYFSHVEGVHEGRSWLYSHEVAIIGDLEGLDPLTRRATFVTSDDVPVAAEALAWFDGWWQASQITIVLDKEHVWTRVTFEAADAFASHEPGWTQLRPAAGATRGENEVLLPMAWDHEHCMICNTHIDPGSEGYVDDERNWLCPACYSRFAARQDLRFVRNAVWHGA
jgi:hypothetical protein